MSLPDKRWLSVQEFADRTGYNQQTIRRFVRAGQIRSGRRRGAKPGRGVPIRIPVEEVERFIRMEEVA